MARHKTPLRYPGGKQKLAPFVAEVLSANDLLGGEYVEPYAGGAGVAVELLLSRKVSRIHLNDASYPLFAFWHCVLNDTDALCRLILSASLTVTEWRRQKEVLSAGKSEKFSRLETAFSFFFLNRCNRSGILTGGLIGGVEQVGEWKMDARFPITELIQRIESIALQKEKIKLRNWDAERFIEKYVPRLPDATLVYCDPPYFNKAERLYLHHYKKSDHARLAEKIQAIDHHWMVSYDATPEVLSFYQDRRSFEYRLQYNASDAYVGEEMFVFSDYTTIPDSSSLTFVERALAKML